MDAVTHFVNDTVEFYKWSLSIAGKNLIGHLFGRNDKHVTVQLCLSRSIKSCDSSLASLPPSV